MFDGITDIQKYILTGCRDLQLNKFHLVQLGIPFVILAIYDYISLNKDTILLMDKLSGWGRWLIYYFMIFLIILVGNFGSTQFVYFQF